MTVTILNGDCRDVLKTLPDESVHCVVTSPPYFGLRDYGTAKWEGGDTGCDHQGTVRASDKSTLAGYTSEDVKIRSYGMPFRDQCGKCGARRIDSQIGLEPTPDAFVAEMVAVFREVRRVLRSDGTLWLNLGDSYAGSWGAQSREHAGKHAPNVSALSANQVKAAAIRTSGTGSASRTPGLKPKDLIGIPWRVAFALQAPDYLGRPAASLPVAHSRAKGGRHHRGDLPVPAHQAEAGHRRVEPTGGARRLRDEARRQDTSRRTGKAEALPGDHP